jgi:hypothetical protein
VVSAVRGAPRRSTSQPDGAKLWHQHMLTPWDVRTLVTASNFLSLQLLRQPRKTPAQGQVCTRGTPGSPYCTAPWTFKPVTKCLQGGLLKEAWWGANKC